MFVFQIIHQVYEKFRGLPVRLAERHNLSQEWFRSHGYPPKTIDAFGNGNPCPEIENYFRKVEDFESCASGAGLFLNELVYAELKCRLRGYDDVNCSQRELRRQGLKEASEAIQALDKCDFKDASKNDLEEMTSEVADLSNWVQQTFEHLRREVEKRECAEQHGFPANKAPQTGISVN